MQFIAGFLATVFQGLFALAVQYFTKRVAIATAVSATLLAATVAFYAGIKAIIAGLRYTITDPAFLMAFYAVKPSNLETCLTVCFAADVAAFLYRFQLITIRSVASAT